MESILTKPKEEIVDLLRYHKYLVSYLKSEAKYEDKIWVIKQVLPKQLLIQWAVAVARSVEHYFTEKHPSDKRVTELLDFMESIKDFENMSKAQIEKLNKLKNAAAYYAAAADAAANAAYAAYHAANAAAYHAANAAAYAAYAYAAAAYAADSADASKNKEKQKELNIQLAIKTIIKEDIVTGKQIGRAHV